MAESDSACRSCFLWRALWRVALFLRHHVIEEITELLLQISTSDDRIDKAVIDHELGSLEAGREVLVGRFLDDAGARKADHALGFG